MTKNLRSVLTRELLKVLDETQDCGYKATMKSVDLFKDSSMTFGIAGSERIIRNEQLVKKILDILDKYCVFDSKQGDQQELVTVLLGIAFNLSTTLSNITECSHGFDKEDKDEY